MVAKCEVAGCSSRQFFTVKSLFLRPSPRNFRACGALLGGAARRSRLRRTPPSASTPVSRYTSSLPRVLAQLVRLERRS